jgi:hypothetical protein
MVGPFTNANSFGMGLSFGNQDQGNNSGSVAASRLAEFSSFTGNVSSQVVNVTNQDTISNANNLIQARIGGLNVQFAPAQEPGRIGRMMGDIHNL